MITIRLGQPKRRRQKWVGRFGFLATLALAATLVSPFCAGEESKEKYLELLLERPEPGAVFDRFVGDWTESEEASDLDSFFQETSRSNPAGWVLLGHWRLRQRRGEAAFEAFSTADPDRFPDTLYWRAAALHLSGQFEKALAALETASRSSSLSPKLHEDIVLKRGSWLLESGKREEAIAAWEKSLSPDAPDDRFQDILIAETKAGLFEAAAATAERLARRTNDPHSQTAAFLKLGEARAALDQIDLAEQAWRQALESSGSGSWIEKEILSRVSTLFHSRDRVSELEKLLRRWSDQLPRRLNLRRSLAETIADLGKNEEAEKLYIEIIRLSPGNSEEVEHYAKFLEKTGDLATATDLYEQLIEKDPDDPDLYIRLARLLHASNESERLRKTINAYVEKSDHSDSAYIEGARLFEIYRQFDAAEELHRIRIERYPANLAAKEDLAGYLHRQNRGDEALAIWKEVFAGLEGIEGLRVIRVLTSQRQVRAAWELLLSRRQSWQNEAAFLAEFCRAAITVNQAEAALPEAERLVIMADSLADLEAALDASIPVFSLSSHAAALRKRLEKTGTGIQRIILLAVLFDLEDRTAEAIETLDTAPPGGRALALEVKLRILENRKMWPQAITAATAALDRGEARRTATLRRLTDYSERIGSPAETLRWIEKWKKNAPGSAEPWLRQVRILTGAGRFEAAEKTLEEASRHFREEPRIKEKLAETYLNRGKEKDARRVYADLYEAAAELSDKLQWAGKYAESASRLGKESEVIRFFENRHRTAPMAEGPMLALFQFYRDNGEPEKARTWIRTLLRNHPGHVGAFHHLAAMEEQLGNFNEAKAALRTAMKLDPASGSAMQLALGNPAQHAAAPGKLTGFIQQQSREGNWDRIVSAIDELIEKPDVGKDHRMLYLKGVALAKRGLVNRAIEHFIELLLAGNPTRQLPASKIPPALRSEDGEALPWPETYAEYRDFRIVTNRLFEIASYDGNTATVLPASAYETELLTFAQLQMLLPRVPRSLAAAYRKRLESRFENLEWWLHPGTVYPGGDPIFDAVPNSMADDPAAILDRLLMADWASLESLQRAVEILEPVRPDCALLAIPLASQHESKEARDFVRSATLRLLGKAKTAGPLLFHSADQIAQAIYWDWDGFVAAQSPETARVFAERTRFWLSNLPAASPFRENLFRAQSMALRFEGRWVELAALLDSEARRFRGSGQPAKARQISFPPQALPHYPDWLIAGVTGPIGNGPTTEEIAAQQNRVFRILFSLAGGIDPVDEIREIAETDATPVDELILAGAYLAKSDGRMSERLIGEAVSRTPDWRWKSKLEFFRIKTMANHLSENPHWKQSLAEMIDERGKRGRDKEELEYLFDLCVSLGFEKTGQDIERRLSRWQGQKPPSVTWTGFRSGRPSARIARLMGQGQREGAALVARTQLIRYLQETEKSREPWSPFSLISAIDNHRLAGNILRFAPDDDLDERAWMRQARIALLLGRLESVEAACKMALEKSPDHPEASALLAIALSLNGKHEESARLLLALGDSAPEALQELRKVIRGAGGRTLMPTQGLLLTAAEYLRISRPTSFHSGGWIVEIATTGLMAFRSEPEWAPVVEMLAREMLRFPKLSKDGLGILIDLELASGEAEPKFEFAGQTGALLESTLGGEDLENDLSPQLSKLTDYWIDSLYSKEEMPRDEVARRVDSLVGSAVNRTFASELKETARAWIEEEQSLISWMLEDPTGRIPRTCRIAQSRKLSLELNPPQEKTLIENWKGRDLSSLERAVALPGHLARSGAGISAADQVLEQVGLRLASLRTSGSKGRASPLFNWLKLCLQDGALFPAAVSFVHRYSGEYPELAGLSYSLLEKKNESAFLGQVIEMIRYSGLFDRDAENVAIPFPPHASPTMQTPLFFAVINKIRGSRILTKETVVEELQRRNKGDFLTELAICQCENSARNGLQFAAFRCFTENLRQIRNSPNRLKDQYAVLLAHVFRNGKPESVTESHWDAALAEFDFFSRKKLDLPDWVALMLKAETAKDLGRIYPQIQTRLESGLRSLILQSPDDAAKVARKLIRISARSSLNNNHTTYFSADRFWKKIHPFVSGADYSPETAAFLGAILKEPEIGKRAVIQREGSARLGSFFVEAISNSFRSNPGKTNLERFAAAYGAFETRYSGDEAIPELAAAFAGTIDRSVSSWDCLELDAWLKEESVRGRSPALAEAIRMGLLHHYETRRWARGEYPATRPFGESFQWYHGKLLDETLPLRVRLVLAREAVQGAKEPMLPGKVVYAAANVLKEAIELDYEIDGETYGEIARCLARAEKTEQWESLAEEIVGAWFLLENPNLRRPMNSTSRTGLALLELILGKDDSAALNRFLLSHHDLIHDQPGTVFLLVRAGRHRLAGSFVRKNWTEFGYDFPNLFHDGTHFFYEGNAATAFAEGAGSQEIALLGKAIVESVPELKLPKPGGEGGLEKVRPLRHERIQPLIAEFTGMEFSRAAIGTEVLRRLVHRNFDVPPVLLPFVKAELTRQPVDVRDLIRKGDEQSARIAMAFPYAMTGASTRVGDVFPLGDYLTRIKLAKPDNNARTWLLWETMEHFSQNIHHSWPREPERIARDLIPILWEFLEIEKQPAPNIAAYALSCLLTAHILTGTTNDFAAWWEELGHGRRSHLIMYSMRNPQFVSGLASALSMPTGAPEPIPVERRVEVINKMMAAELFQIVYKDAPDWYVHLKSQNILTAGELAEHFHELNNSQKRGGWEAAERAEILAEAGQLDAAIALIQTERAALVKTAATMEQEQVERYLARLALGESRAWFAGGRLPEARAALERRSFPDSVMPAVRLLRKKIEVSR